MSQAATLTSVANGQCCCHSDPTCISMTGTIISGSPDVFISGLSAARMGELVQGNCGHFGTIISGAADTLSNGIPAARMGDLVYGCLIMDIISGPSDTLIA